MPLVPGPFLQVADSAVDVAPGVWDFETDAQTLADSLLQLDSLAAPAFDTLADIETEPLDDIDNTVIDDVLGALDTAEGLAAFVSLDGALSNYDVGDTQLTAAVSYAPPQAWVNPPEPFIPPDSAPPIVSPTIALSGFTPGDYTPTMTPPPQSGPSVQVLNVTKPGQSNFVVGDQFQVIVTGQPGQDVSVVATLNGKTLDGSDFGTIDASGTLKISGTMAPENAGAWLETWSLDGTPIANVNFLVGASGSNF